MRARLTLVLAAAAVAVPLTGTSNATILCPDTPGRTCEKAVATFCASSDIANRLCAVTR